MNANKKYWIQTKKYVSSKKTSERSFWVILCYIWVVYFLWLLNRLVKNMISLRRTPFWMKSFWSDSPSCSLPMTWKVESNLSSSMLPRAVISRAKWKPLWELCLEDIAFASSFSYCSNINHKKFHYLLSLNKFSNHVKNVTFNPFH